LFRKEQKFEIDTKLKAIDLDIDQTKFLIEEQKTLQKNDPYNSNVEKNVETTQEENEKKTVKNIAKEQDDSFLSFQSQDDSRQTLSSERMKSMGPVASYQVDENIKPFAKNYECYVCRII